MFRQAILEMQILIATYFSIYFEAVFLNFVFPLCDKMITRVAYLYQHVVDLLKFQTHFVLN